MPASRTPPNGGERSPEPGGQPRLRPPPAAAGSLGAILAALAVASVAVGWWVGQARVAPPRPVERFTHIHGLDAPAWAGGDLLVATHHGLVRRTVDGDWFLVGETQHDLMGFRAVATEGACSTAAAIPTCAPACPTRSASSSAATAG
jgi:hypothetical protein